MLSGKRLLITGVVNTESIAFATAVRAQSFGAQVILTALERDRNLCEEAAKELANQAEVFSLDVTQPNDFDVLEQTLRERYQSLDGALHAVAFAPRETLSGTFYEADPERVKLAFHTSAASFAGLAKLLAQLAPQGSASLVGLDFDAARAWQTYNWMGVCKAALEATNRYLARDLGPRNIRSNLIAAGPLHTRAAGGIANFESLTQAWEQQSPIQWDPTNPRPVADAACFLFSDLSAAITGEILHVDGGYHAIAAPRTKDIL